MAFHATILTLFPEMFPGPLGHSLLGRALREGIWSLECLNLREFGIGKHQLVDDTPYGGGAGMVMRADVLGAAIDEAFRRQADAQLIYFTPRGVPLTQSLAVELTAMSPRSGRPNSSRSTESENLSGIILICGRYEGIDERIIEKYQPLEISLGDFVMTGGEIAAMALLDACVRLQPGVVGEADSLQQESFGLSQDYACLLEHPHYTKPPLWEGYGVPEVLTSGHHEQIDRWRKAQSETITKARRPDLWNAYTEGTNR